MVRLLEDPESDSGRLARKVLAGHVPIEDVLGAVSHAQWGSPHWAEVYRSRVEQTLGELRRKTETGSA